jgi:quinol monooxygenase YgiN
MRPFEVKAPRMLIVTGSLTAHGDTFEELKAVSLDHVRRSRTEPGCISHAVHVDCENPLRLVFFEEWSDPAALETHYAVAKPFIRSLRGLAAASTGPTVYETRD